MWRVGIHAAPAGWSFSPVAGADKWPKGSMQKQAHADRDTRVLSRTHMRHAKPPSAAVG